ncbi:MAG: cytoplasmic protein, partial [Armatimonadetes bacterium]|nr:cytoplasmic protein [Armatimonadota bacterium]
MQPDYILAHKHSSKHKSEIFASTDCGCFYCRQIFLPTEIFDWIDNKQTAICPHCGVDAVVGSASGITVTKHLLNQMHDHWFK